MMSGENGGFELFVNGTLMRGLALHDNLDGAEFLGECLTESHYRMHNVGGIHPGMYRVNNGGRRIGGELYRVPPVVWSVVEAGEPSGLYRGDVELDDGRWVSGVLYPEELARAYPDISDLGSWRASVATNE